MEIQQSKDTCIEKLTSTSGVDLEITCNLTNQNQVGAVMEGYICKQLNVSYGIEKFQMLLRLTDGWKGRCRDDLTGIGKTSDMVPGWNLAKDGES